jgi:protein SCO1/2
MHLSRVAVFVFSAVIVLVTGSCSQPRSYTLEGQILNVDERRQEITIKHGDIKGFMPGMTMAFKVKDSRLLDGRRPGDLVRATLVVEESVGYLSSVEATGHAPLAEPGPARAGLELLKPGEEIPDVQLVDQEGHVRQLAGWRGTILAVTFVYTRCPLPDFCVLMDRQFSAVQRAALADEKLRRTIHLLSVTVDPAFDTPAVLREHAKRVGSVPDVWTWATGDRDELDRFGARFGVSVMRDDPREVVHNLRTAVVGADGRLVRVFSGNDWAADELLQELRNAAGRR